MAQVLVRDIKPAVVDRLKNRAHQKGRSLEAELRLILEEAAGISFEEVARVRGLFSGRVFDDSSELIREDRDR